MTVETITPGELDAWLQTKLAHATTARERSDLVCQFGGERAAAVQDGGAVFVRDEIGDMIAVASYTPSGEDNNGTPAIVGLWADAGEMRPDIHALTAFMAAMEQLQGDVRFDACTPLDRQMLTLLPRECKTRLK